MARKRNDAFQQALGNKAQKEEQVEEVRLGGSKPQTSTISREEDVQETRLGGGKPNQTGISRIESSDTSGAKIKEVAK